MLTDKKLNQFGNVGAWKATLNAIKNEKSNINLLFLFLLEQVTVLDKLGDETGWWKAYDGRKIGYIPKNYVEIVVPP